MNGTALWPSIRVTPVLMDASLEMQQLENGTVSTTFHGNLHRIPACPGLLEATTQFPEVFHPLATAGDGEIGGALRNLSNHWRRSGRN